MTPMLFATLKSLFFLLILITTLAVCSLEYFSFKLQIKLYLYLNFVGTGGTTSRAFSILSGLLVLLLTFFGCCASMMSKPWMLKVFSLTLIFVVLLELVTAIRAYSQINDLEITIRANMEKELAAVSTSDNQMPPIWNNVQSIYLCCGIKDYKNWYNIKNFSEAYLPESCCRPTGTVQPCNAESKELFKEGCLENLKAELENCILSEFNASILSIVFMILCSALSFYLAWIMEKNFYTTLELKEFDERGLLKSERMFVTDKEPNSSDYTKLTLPQDGKPISYKLETVDELKEP